MGDPAIVDPPAGWAGLAARLDGLERALGPDERYQWQIMLSELICSAYRGISTGRIAPVVWDDLTGRVGRLTEPGVLFCGPAPSVLDFPTLRSEAARLAADPGGRTGAVAYVRAGPATVRAQADPAVVDWVAELAGGPVVPFGTPYFYVYDRAGDHLPMQLHEFAMRENVPGSAPVIALSVLLERSGSGDAGRLYVVDRSRRPAYQDRDPGDCVLYRATGTVHGRAELADGDRTVNTVLRWVPSSPAAAAE